jgi:hypothetical protein
MMFGRFRRSRMNERHCRLYEITAANTAIFRTAATTWAAPSPP